MFERFTQDARAVVVQAQQQARRLGHHYIGCEHLLLAVVSADTSAGAALRGVGLTPVTVEQVLLGLVGTPDGALDRAALASIGIDLDLVQKKVEAVFGSDALGRRPRRAPLAWAPVVSPGSRPPEVHPASQALPRELPARGACPGRPAHRGRAHLARPRGMPDGVIPQLLPAIGVFATQVRAAVQEGYRQAG